MKNILRFVIVGIALALQGCGVTTPPISLSDDSAEAAAVFANGATVHVHCELRKAVLFTYDRLNELQHEAEWLKDWAGKITLTINVDEKIGINPGLAVTKFFRSYSNTLRGGEVITGSRTAELGIGGGLSSTATREQEITWFLVFRDFFDERAHVNAKCEKSPFLMEGDLKIKETLYSGAFAGSLPRNTSDPFKSGGRLQVVQHTVSFLIEASGNVTPSWRFVDVTSNAGGSFFGLNRNRKDTLLVTMGPTQLSDSGRPLRERRVVPSASVDSSHLARQIGTSIGASIMGIR